MMIMRGMGNHQTWVTVAVFEDSSAAKVVKEFLAGKGMEARTYDDKLFRYFLFLRPPQVTYRVQVRKSSVGDVDEFWAADSPTALERALRCPVCKSLSVSYPQLTRKFFLPTIILHLGIIFHLLDHECYCEHCHYVWNLPIGHVSSSSYTAHFPSRTG